jgi:hypothetical protein
MNNFEDDEWGFYVDFDNNCYDRNNIDYEDEYYYSKKNTKNTKNIKNKKNDKNDKNDKNVCSNIPGIYILVRISSTTLFTFVVTYLILHLL